MSHTVLVLDDQVRSGQATERMIHLWDPAAEVIHVRTVADAVETLQANERIAYAIIDLLLEPSPADQQGKAFVQWLLGEPRFSKMPMLILSAFPEMIRDLNVRRSETVKVVTKTTDFDTIHAALKPFIETARREYDK